jgi:hypothetical protein
MYWYLKNLHNETILRNNLYEISRNFAKFREISRKKYYEISRNFAKLKSLSSSFRISRNKKILFRDHPKREPNGSCNDICKTGSGLPESDTLNAMRTGCILEEPELHLNTALVDTLKESNCCTTVYQVCNN